MKTKINKSELFKSAWKTYRGFQGEMSFSKCLAIAWSRVKLAKVFAKDLSKGMKLKNGNGIVKGVSKGLNTPKGKVDISILWPNGLTRLHTWNCNTKILVAL